MLGLFILTNKTNAQSQGANSPVWVLNVNWMCQTCTGATWGGLTNAEHNDGNFAKVTLQPVGICNTQGCYYSREFTPNYYNFTIPASATITGIELQVKKKASADNSIIDRLIQLMNDDTLVGVSRAAFDYWTTADSVYYYGSSTDLWGYNWTPAMINSIYFGAWLKAENKVSTIDTAYIDWVGIKVYYTIATGTGTNVSSTSDNINVHFDAASNNLLLTTSFEENIHSSVLTIYNMLGQVQFKKELSSISKGDVSNEIRTNSLIPGIYMVEFLGGGKDFVKKMVVVK